MGRPVVMAEIGAASAGRQHEVVVADGLAVGQAHGLGGGIDARHFAEHDLYRLLAAEDAADGLGDVGRRQRRRRDLVEQRLEQMMVVTVDHRHADAGLA